ncbi:DUF4238 domain-containing protein [Prescottella equi]|uniref:DUF4238 domain-containing protein n=1 Tax=Rhodococcus hoagii TaxID=43767 RepID=UPI0015854DBE|nr:DUF4238 domain-containing protein [Prescottella equi]
MEDPRIRRVVARAKAYTGDPTAPAKHHFVPRSYLDRWAVDGVVRRTLVDTKRWRDIGLKGVAYEDHFYRLEAEDVDPQVTPPLFLEVLFGELEDEAKRDIDKLLQFEPGAVTNAEIIANMSLYLAAQHVRGRAFRDEQLTIVEWSATQDQLKLSVELTRFLLQLAGDLDPDRDLVEELAAQMRAKEPISADPKAQAIQLTVQQWLRFAPHLAAMEWAVYRTESSILTSDEPVLLLGLPGTDRGERPGLLVTGAIAFPLSPERLLVLFPRGPHGPDYPYVLSADETQQINAELMATAEKMVFEQPGGSVALGIDVPPRGPGREITDSDGNPAVRYRKPTRWAGMTPPPSVPLSRWYKARDIFDLGCASPCCVLSCGRGADAVVTLPEVANRGRGGRGSYYYGESSVLVCEAHREVLADEAEKSEPGYVVDFNWRDPQSGRSDLRVRYPA